MMPRMSALTDRFLPFKTPDARRLAMLFAIVYFSQGMYYVADQARNLALKETLGLSPAQVATFGTITLVPWLIKPVYGLISDAFRCLAGGARATFCSPRRSRRSRASRC